MKRRTLLGVSLVAAGSFAAAAERVRETRTKAPPMNTFPLWPEGRVPGALGTAPKDTPTLTVFPAPKDKNNGAAIIVCPGGGYSVHAPHEADPLADWANTLGATGFVLRYRLSPGGYHHPAMLQDAQRAVRTVRARAGEWGIDPLKIGVLGFSAGGHLASTVATHHDLGKPNDADSIERAACRPDFAILIYPVISFVAPYSHKGSSENLLGKTPDAALLHSLSNETQVKADTPPCYLVHGANDAGVPVQNSLSFASALAEHKVPFGMTVFARGEHGFGMGDESAATYKKELNSPVLKTWPHQCADFLRQMGFIA